MSTATIERNNAVTSATTTQGVATTPQGSNKPLRGFVAAPPVAQRNNLPVLRKEDLTETDRREVYLWIVLGRFEEAQAAGNTAAASKLETAFKKRLADYCAACDGDAA